MRVSSNQLSVGEISIVVWFSKNFVVPRFWFF
jgi:hypothetical protein